MFCKAQQRGVTWLFFDDDKHGKPRFPSFFGVITYKPYSGGLKPSFFMVLGSKGTFMPWVSGQLNLSQRFDP